MEAAFFELSKYILAILLAFYTFECFAVFRYKNPDDKNGIYFRQNIIMFFIHFIGFMAICFKTGDMFYLFFFGFQQIVLLGTIASFRTIYPTINKLTVNNMCMLLTISFIVLSRISKDKALKQFKIVLISLIISLFIPILIKKIKFLKSLTWMYGFFGFAVLSAVLVMGSATNGSKISYSMYGFTFQPSEFVKIIFVFFVASALCKKNNRKRIVLSAIVAAFHVFVLVVSKDLGSALIFFIVYITMLYVATKKARYLIMGFVAGCIGSVFAYYIFNHVQVRYEVWLNPWTDIQGKGYQITQSLFAIGTGGWFGMGIYQGTPGSIPYVAADFIFSAIAEEFGVIFSLCLILLCISCFIMFMNIAMKLKDEFYRLIAVGLGVTYIFQVFLTIGGGTKFIPLTGVTLPLISYGGSSVLTTLIIFSIIQGLYLINTEESNLYYDSFIMEDNMIGENNFIVTENVLGEEGVLDGEMELQNKYRKKDKKRNKRSQ